VLRNVGRAVEEVARRGEPGVGRFVETHLVALEICRTRAAVSWRSGRLNGKRPRGPDQSAADPEPSDSGDPAPQARGEQEAGHHEADAQRLGGRHRRRLIAGARDVTLVETPNVFVCVRSV
jgi:hypothetical protein